MKKDIPKDAHCENNNFKSVRYFHGMLITEQDFKAEQIYHEKKRKLLNRMLHGWGVVCGLEIKTLKCSNSKIKINSGMALDCAGNEIVVCEPYEFDVIKAIGDATRKKSTLTDCSEENLEETINKWYVVIRYKETPVDPVPVYTNGCGCEEKVCEHSRTREGYCIDLVRPQELKGACPEPLRELREPREEGDPCKDYECKSEDEKRKFICDDLLLPCEPCDCCDNELVVLGSISYEEEIEDVKDMIINNWDCRKYVITFQLIEHWMNKFAPQKVPFETIVNYANWGSACNNKGPIAEAFDEICGKVPQKCKNGSNRDDSTSEEGQVPKQSLKVGKKKTTKKKIQKENN